MSYQVSYITSDYYKNDQYIWSDEPIYCFDSLNLSSILTGTKNNTALTQTEINSFTSSSGSGISFTIDGVNDTYNIQLTFKLQNKLQNLSQFCIITGYKISFDYFFSSRQAEARVLIMLGTSKLSISKTDFVENQYTSDFSPDQWYSKTLNMGSDILPILPDGKINLKFDLIRGSSTSGVFSIRNLKIEEIYYIPRCQLYLNKFDTIESYMLDYHTLRTNDGYGTLPNTVSNSFTAENYSYNNNLYSFGFENWRLDPSEHKLNSVSGSTPHVKVVNLLKQQLNTSTDLVGTYFDKDLTLYLVEPTLLNYTITYNYNSNGATNTYEDTATPNSTYTILSNEVLYENTNNLDPSKNIAGWTETQGSTVVTYTPQSTFTITKNTVLYAIWEDRDSVIINPSVANITTVSFNTTPSAQNGLTYYFNRGLNKKVTLSINPTATGSGEYYIYSVSGATGTITPTGQRSWTGNDVANTGSSAVLTTINIVYHKNLLFYFFLCAIEKNKLSQPNFSTDFLLGGNELLQELEDTTEEGYNYKYKTKNLNPGDSITHTVSCVNSNYYISRIISPNTTGSNYPYDGSPDTDELPGSFIKKRLELIEGYSGNNISVSITDDSCTSLTYTLTIPTGSSGVALMGDETNINVQRAYAVYEPFHCQYQINNYNYTLNLYETMGYRIPRASLITQDTSVANREQYTIKFFNDVSINPSYYIRSYRSKDSTKHVISNISSQDSDLILNNYLTFVLSGNLTSNENYNGFNLQLDQNIAGYNLNKFTGWRVCPTQYMLDNYHIPYVIDVTWNSNDYKCFIILKLPETQENEINIANATEFNTTGWTNISDSNLNRNIYIKEISNTSSTTSINASLKDVANAGYILKQIDKYTFDGTYNSDCTTETNHTTVTREQLDSGIVLQNWIRTSPDSSGSNDKLSFNKTFTSADSGVVDYYFIIYEEGLPIFYPGDENDPKRAIQLFWENTRAIGLYYENTRLL